MTLERYFEELAQGDEALQHSRLASLSGLDSTEMEHLRHWWPSIPTDRRQEMMSRLVTLAEDEVDLDFDAVFRHSLKDDDPVVRERAISGLWECDDRTLISSLITLLKEDPVERVRASAALSLGRFSTFAALGKLLPKDGERVQEALIGVVENDAESAEVRRRALESVAVFNEGDIPQLIQDAYHSDDETMQLSAVYAMGLTCNTTWLSTIFSELNSNDPAMRYEAANACGEMGEEEAVPYLIALLKDDDLQVQLASIRALGILGGRPATRALQECLRSDEEAIKEAAEAALEQTEAEGSPFNFRSRLGQR
ncbi:MAG: HEAT repeat domain-containing protein [Chloroflexi bacterium]|nr:HEAT repeat domain-containing protein [Chloroflexota bacterium]